MSTRRPDLRAYFKAQIARHVNGGFFSSPSARLPADVERVTGTVTDRQITATMRDGSVWHWSGGQYAARKVNLCYAPLMPRPVLPENGVSTDA